jgi:potassium-transporting ATPase KdpC subunit
LHQLSRLPHWLAQQLVAARVVVALTLLVGVAYPLAMTAAAQMPGLRHSAQGSTLTGVDGRKEGSSLVGQSFTDTKGNPLPYYFQSRPSEAGAGYDAAASGASNFGPESVVDVLPVKGKPDSGKESLLTQVCARSKAVGELEHVDGSRPYCTSDGVGAVLGVFRADGTTGRVVRVISLDQACPARPFLTHYAGVRVACAEPGADHAAAVVTPVRGDAPAHPKVPADAVTASASGLDPDISPAYADLQAPRVARERGVSEAAVLRLVHRFTTGRALGVLGQPAVNVAELNLALDRTYPERGV